MPVIPQVWWKQGNSCFSIKLGVHFDVKGRIHWPFDKGNQRTGSANFLWVWWKTGWWLFPIKLRPHPEKTGRTYFLMVWWKLWQPLFSIKILPFLSKISSACPLEWGWHSGELHRVQQNPAYFGNSVELTGNAIAYALSVIEQQDRNSMKSDTSKRFRRIPENRALSVLIRIEGNSTRSAALKHLRRIRSKNVLSTRPSDPIERPQNGLSGPELTEKRE